MGACVGTMSMFLASVVLVMLCASIVCDGFSVQTPGRTARAFGRQMSMKWRFGKGMGSMAEVGGIGAAGEYYFIQGKRPTLIVPDTAAEAGALGEERTIPIFPRNQVRSCTNAHTSYRTTDPLAPLL